MSIPNSIIHAFKKCKSAKELWNSLQQMYEGSHDVKENKKDMLKQKFENFCQENNEKMASQYLRYVRLVDELIAAGVNMENQDVIRKFLRSLPHAWNIYFVTIQRIEDFRTLKLGEFLGILSAYQMEIDAQESKQTTYVPHGSTPLYAPIHNPPFQNYQLIHQLNSTPIITFPETQTPSTSHSNPFQTQLHCSHLDVSTSNNALMANDSNSTFKVIDEMCTPECLEKLISYNGSMLKSMMSLSQYKLLEKNFLEVERNYKEKIIELEKIISTKYVQTGSTSSSEYVTCSSDKSHRARSGYRNVSIEKVQVNHSNQSHAGISKSKTCQSSSEKYNSESSARRNFQKSSKDQPTCLVYGDTDHYATNCF
ncbi:hypothetical protein E3N88_22970 [Mikania micrantha]|uniref:Uncharacterized protein n=1 Tax=Mikania micrantha TaxID=192012 RepID=A0A5N6ND16_9ASTR|nr:hypothetical protein E3N88_22970 [Mikania micrantha]